MGNTSFLRSAGTARRASALDRVTDGFARRHARDEDACELDEDGNGDRNHEDHLLSTSQGTAAAVVVIF